MREGIQDLRERRTALAKEASNLLRQHTHDWTEEEHGKKFGELEKQIYALDNQIQSHQRLVDLTAEKVAREQGLMPTAAGEPPRFHGENGRVIHVLSKGDSFSNALDASLERPSFGFGEFVRGMVLGTSNPEVRNVLAEGTDSAGGYTVPTFLMARLIDRMRAKTVCIQAGALTVPLETQKVSIARLASDPTASWRAENAAVGESDPTFERVQFTARSLAVLVKCSRELLEDSINVEDALMNAFAGSMAVTVDRAGLIGSGVAPEPLGVFGTTNVNSVSLGVNGAQLTNHDKLLDALYEIELDNAGPASAAVMHPRTWRVIQGFKDTTNQPLLPPPALKDLPLLTTTSVPIDQTQGTANNASSIIMGDFKQMMIGVRSYLRIEVLKERYAENMQYAFLAHLRADVQFTHPEAFTKVIGIIP